MSKLGWFLVCAVLIAGAIAYSNATFTGYTTSTEFVCMSGDETTAYLPQLVVYRFSKTVVETCTESKPYCNPISAGLGVADCCVDCKYEDQRIICKGCTKNVKFTNAQLDQIRPALEESISNTMTTEWWKKEEEKPVTTVPEPENQVAVVEEQTEPSQSFWSKVWGAISKIWK